MTMENQIKQQHQQHQQHQQQLHWFEHSAPVILQKKFRDSSEKNGRMGSIQQRLC